MLEGGQRKGLKPVLGLILVVIGVVFLLRNLGFLPEGAWSTLWPVLLVLLGLFLIWRHGRERFYWEEKFGWRKREGDE